MFGLSRARNLACSRPCLEKVKGKISGLNLSYDEVAGFQFGPLWVAPVTDEVFAHARTSRKKGGHFVEPKLLKFDPKEPGFPVPDQDQILEYEITKTERGETQVQSISGVGGGYIKKARGFPLDLPYYVAKRQADVLVAKRGFESRNPGVEFNERAWRMMKDNAVMRETEEGGRRARRAPEREDRRASAQA